MIVSGFQSRQSDAMDQICFNSVLSCVIMLLWGLSRSYRCQTGSSLMYSKHWINVSYYYWYVYCFSFCIIISCYLFHWKEDFRSAKLLSSVSHCIHFFFFLALCQVVFLFWLNKWILEWRQELLRKVGVLSFEVTKICLVCLVSASLMTLTRALL